jgi:hypothetical protein
LIQTVKRQPMISDENHSAAQPQPNGHKKHEKAQRLLLKHKGHKGHQGDGAD